MVIFWLRKFINIKRYDISAYSELPILHKDCTCVSGFVVVLG